MTKTEALGMKLRALQALRGYDSQRMGILTHTSKTTWNRRIKDPGSITVDELIRLEKHFGASLLNTDVKA